jgi:prepilin-type N-terminal cleavage/methylation domain-containing protein
MIRQLRDIQARRRGEVVDSGFTLIELLVVIVVLGILAATVVFALTGVSGQSAVAACNSDAKTIETAVQAYINSPDNTGNTAPAVGAPNALVAAPFNSTGDPLTSGTGDSFLHAIPTNTAYTITLGTGGAVMVATTSHPTAVEYDAPGGGTNPCSTAS